MASIGLHGKNERRYFTGVQGQKGQEGELFGLANLLKLETEKVITDGRRLNPNYLNADIIKRTKKAEEEFTIQTTSSTDKESSQNNTETSAAETDDMKALFGEYVPFTSQN